MLPVYCIGIAYLLYWCCLSTVLVLPIYCIGVAYLLYWCCLSTVLVLPSTVLVLPSTVLALPMYMHTCIGVAITELVLLYYSHLSLFVLRSCCDLIAAPSLGGADHVIINHLLASF